jgi:hypothetical protein
MVVHMVLALVTSLVLAQSLPVGAVGAAFVERETADTVTLRLQFDQWDVDDTPVWPSARDELLKFRVATKVLGPVVVLDAKGVVLAVGSPRFELRFACENDGGLRFAASARVTVKKRALARPLAPRPGTDGLVGFAVVGQVERAGPLEAGEGTSYFTADLDRDGTPDARLSGSLDEAMNCGEARGKHWSVWLTTSRGVRPFRCCGP